MDVNDDLNASADGGSNPTVHNQPSEPKVIIRKKKKEVLKDVKAAASASTASSSSSSCAFSSISRSKGGGGFKPRHSRVAFPPAQRRTGSAIRDGYTKAVAFPLGMSFAAVIAQASAMHILLGFEILICMNPISETLSCHAEYETSILQLIHSLFSLVLERKDGVHERMSVDHLSRICTSVVKESLANVFCDDFDFLERNFEISFGSTLRTLRLINEWGANKREGGLNHLNVGNSGPNANKRVDHASNSDGEGCSSRAGLSNIPTEDKSHLPEEQEQCICTDSLNREVALHRQPTAAHASSSTSGSSSQMSTMDRYFMEQARSNDLKAWENCIAMENLRLKKEKLALRNDSNDIERSKLAMAVSKASKRDELLKKCIKVLVAGSIVMSAAFSYATYVYSYVCS